MTVPSNATATAPPTARDLIVLGNAIQGLGACAPPCTTELPPFLPVLVEISQEVKPGAEQGAAAAAGAQGTAAAVVLVAADQEGLGGQLAEQEGAAAKGHGQPDRGAELGARAPARGGLAGGGELLVQQSDA